MLYNRGLVDLLSEILGFPKRYGHDIVELEFNCPSCMDGKFNLGVNTDKKKFHCWACEYRGPVERIINDYGTEAHRLEYGKHRVPHFRKKNVDQKEISISLAPFRSMQFEWKDSLVYNEAKRYLRSRKVDKEIIARWDICYAENGPYKDRIIIPSKSENGKVEYFVARDFYGESKLKYKNPPLKKSSIIFGERFIDWKKPVILTEGVFDAIVLPNAVPVLGSKIDGNSKITKKLVDNDTVVILGLDEDKTGTEGKKRIAKHLGGFGIRVFLLPPNDYRDISEAYATAGKEYVANLVRGAKRYDELEFAIQSML